jgi:hypothetical protein
MALTSASLFLYGFQVTANNSSIDFRSVSAETPRQATLNLGYYSLTDLCTEISRAMHAVDTARNFTVTVNRTVSGGLQNRVTIATDGAFLSLLGSSGPRSASSTLPLIGFAAIDYTGATTYTGSASAGTVMIPTRVGYTYIPPEIYKQVFGAVNVSASGLKESVVFSIQKFLQVDFRFEPASRLISDWAPLMDWAIQQRGLEFTPDITVPATFYNCTLEKTENDGKGLSYRFMEHLPDLPGLFKTGLMTFRVRN